MLDENKTRNELIIELKELREQISRSARLENERNRAEEVLHNDEKLLNGIFDGIQDGISVLDREMNIIRVNKTMERWHPDMLPLVGKKCFYAYHGRSEPCEYCPNIKAMKEKTTCVSITPREVGGRIVGWQEVHSFPLLDDMGNVIGLIDYVRDITELKRTEETLKESQQMLQLVMDSIPQAIFWKDTNSVYLGCNKVLARNLGLKDPGEIIGKTDYDLSTTREQSESYRAYDRRVMSTDKPIYHIIEMQRRPDDIIACLDTNKIPLHDSNGNVIGVLCTYEDITERKRAEVALKESEEKYRLIVETTNQGICIIDAGMVITFVNKILAGMLEYSPEEMIDRPVWDFIDEVERAISLEKMEELRKGISEIFEIKITRKDGTPMWAIINAVPRYDKDDKFAGSLAMITDITERKRAEEALRRSEKRFKQLIESSPVPMGLYDKNEDIEYLNDKFIKAFGYTIEDLPNLKDWWRLAYPDEAYRAEIYDSWHRMVEEAIIEGAETRPIENNVTCKDGSVRVIEAIGSPIGDKMLVTFSDITERKRSEEAIKLANAYNRSLIEASLDPLVTISPDGKITDVNLATEAVTGYPREKLIGTDFSDYFTNPDKAKEGYLKVLHDGSVKDYSLEIRHRFGHITSVIYNATIYRDDRGKVIGVFAAARDVTERKRVEEALEEAKNQAEIYIDLMGHDINNLNQVGMGYLELALNTLNLDQKGRELITKPLEALENSSKLIDKVRKIRRINTGEPKLYEIDVARLLRDLIPKYTSINGREVTINYVSGCHCFVMANDLLVDVFSNILGNAVKHSSGPLTINVRVSKAESVNKAYCKVTIEDNGTGIPDDVKKKLFSRFQRGHTKASGKGLGLYLVRSLVHYYHGYVWIEDSVPGDYTKGARFVVMLPVIDDASLYDKFNNG